MNTQFTEAETSMSTKHQKKCYVYLIIMEVHIKKYLATVTYTSIWKKMFKSRKITVARS